MLFQLQVVVNIGILNVLLVFWKQSLEKTFSIFPHYSWALFKSRISFNLNEYFAENILRLLPSIFPFLPG